MERYDLSDPDACARLSGRLHDGHIELADDLASARGTVVLPGWEGSGPVVDRRRGRGRLVQRGTLELPRFTLTVRGVTAVALDDEAGVGTTEVVRVGYDAGWIVVEGALPVDLRLRTGDPVVELEPTGEAERSPWSRLGRWQSGGWERPD